MAAISAPANQRPKGPTLRARGWGQTGPQQEGKARKREGVHVLTSHATCLGLTSYQPHMKLQEPGIYPSVHTSGQSPCTASPLQPHPSMLGEAGMVDYPPQPYPGAGPLYLLLLCPPDQSPTCRMVSPAGHTPKSRNGESGTCQLCLDLCSVFCRP